MSDHAASRALVHPATLAAMAVLALNDHVLKAVWPGAVTGKLSDLAGLAFFPLIPAVVAERVGWARRGARATAVAAALTAAGFAAIKLTAAGAGAYAVVGGVAQWPLHALVALGSGAAVPPLAPVAVVRDPTDLVALVASLVPVVLARRAAAPAAA